MLVAGLDSSNAWKIGPGLPLIVLVGIEKLQIKGGRVVGTIWEKWVG